MPRTIENVTGRLIMMEKTKLFLRRESVKGSVSRRGAEGERQTPQADSDPGVVPDAGLHLSTP